MRACDIDTTGDVWLYKPARHKTSWRGKDRVIPLGPRTPAIVKPFLPLATEAYLYFPALAMAERAVILRSRQKTRVQPSQHNRRRKNPQRAPGDRYDRTSHTRTIASRPGSWATVFHRVGSCSPWSRRFRCAIGCGPKWRNRSGQ
jgi:hypothetical protein